MHQIILMKSIPFMLMAALVVNTAVAQVSITTSDLPVPGDTLRYSIVDPTSFNADLYATGANTRWNFTGLVVTQQGLDQYKFALQVNPLYGASLPLGAYGYKVADTFGSGLGGLPLPIQLPVTITEVYNFYAQKTNPAIFSIEGFAAKINGIGLPAAYRDADEMYYLPLNYGNYDSSDFYLKIQLPTLGGLVQAGTRKTWVDGWGTITTPYFTTPVDCIRLRSMLDEIDTVEFSPLPPIGLPRMTIEYKWLVPGDHYPALWVTTMVVAGMETITSVRYRDSYIPTGVQEYNAGKKIVTLSVYPNPASDVVSFELPGGRAHYTIEMFDIIGKLVKTEQDNYQVSIDQFPSGTYLARVTFEDGVGYASFVKQ